MNAYWGPRVMLDTVLLLLGRNTLWRGCHPWKKLKVLVTQLCLTLSDPVGCNLSGSSVHGILYAKITGVGSCSLLQGIFPTQGLNPGFLHCNQILYCLDRKCGDMIWPNHVCSNSLWVMRCWQVQGFMCYFCLFLCLTYLLPTWPSTDEHYLWLTPSN